MPADVAPSSRWRGNSRNMNRAVVVTDDPDRILHELSIWERLARLVDERDFASLRTNPT
jgi:hypothetical protein